MADVPKIPILLLGDSGVGKSTFLSRLHLGTDGVNTPLTSLANLKDLDQPFRFNIRMYNRPYTFEFSDTASPRSYTLLLPSVIILCFNIGQPESLSNVRQYWKAVVERHFNHSDSIPIILLGLGRDVRDKRDYGSGVRALTGDEEDDNTALNARTFLYPQEGLKAAQAMRCDRYCECSALTGELCREVFEDIAKTAALTTTDKGGKTEGGCRVM